MKEVNLACGITVKVSPEVFDDMEVVDLLADAQDNDVLAVSRLTDKVLGREQKKAVYSAIRGEDGRINIKLFMDIFNEIIVSLGDTEKK